MSSIERACKIAREVIENNVQLYKGKITREHHDRNFQGILDRHCVVLEYVPREPKNFEASV